MQKNKKIKLCRSGALVNVQIKHQTNEQNGISVTVLLMWVPEGLGCVFHQLLSWEFHSL